MTTEQAIKLLHRLQDEQFDGPHGDERREALEMAVRALSGDGDTISRKQVLNASHFVACWDGVEHFSLEVVDADFIQKLPSVQPTQTNADSTQTNTLDCVIREAVLDAIDKYILGKSEGCTVEVRELLKLITKVYHMPIYRMPSAQPERKKGKWISEVKGKKAIIDEYGNVTCSAHCSECGDWLTGSDEYACRGRYCPSCGARMDGESDE